MVAAGASIGFAAALVAGWFLRGMLFGVSAADPISLTAAVGVLVSVALAASYFPARKASRLDPLAALRES